METLWKTLHFVVPVLFLRWSWQSSSCVHALLTSPIFSFICMRFGGWVWSVRCLLKYWNKDFLSIWRWLQMRLERMDLDMLLWGFGFMILCYVTCDIGIWILLLRTFLTFFLVYVALVMVSSPSYKHKIIRWKNMLTSFNICSCQLLKGFHSDFRTTETIYGF